MDLTQINHLIKDVLPIILAIFTTVFILIISARLVLTFLLNQAYKRYLSLKRTSQKIFSKKASFRKEDEELLRKKSEIPKANSQVKAEFRAKSQGINLNNSYELIESEEQQLDRQELNDIKIVDVVKPIGFWTSMILGQKLTYLVQSAQILNKRGNKGFWVSMIEAKEREAGRQHSRGR